VLGGVGDSVHAWSFLSERLVALPEPPGVPGDSKRATVVMRRGRSVPPRVRARP
jgi:hypothetical protein